VVAITTGGRACDQSQYERLLVFAAFAQPGVPPSDCGVITTGFGSRESSEPCALRLAPCVYRCRSRPGCGQRSPIKPRTTPDHVAAPIGPAGTISCMSEPSMPWFAVRCVFATGWPAEKPGAYEERVTLLARKLARGGRRAR
jgi:hypothetical protein